MKQKTLSMIPLLCAAVAPLCADTQGMNNQTAADKQRMYMQEMNKITPTADPAVSRAADPFFSADFIWWRVQEDGLEYAFTGAGNGLVSTSKGKLYHPEFKYEPGFKVGAGLKFRHDGWDLYAQYTWLHTRGSSSVAPDADDDSLLTSNIFVPIDGTLNTSLLASASSSWKVQLNVLDIELGRDFWISKWLTLRPYTGMKFSWNNQRFNATYDGFTPAPILGDDLGLKMKLNQFGVGVRSGLDTAWYMWKHWSIFGEFAATGLLNYFDSHRTDTDTTADIVVNNVKKKSNHRVTAVLEWALGLRYETTWHQDDYMFTIQAGWEEQIWFNQNQFIFMPNSAANDLNFEGLQLKVAFNF